MDARILSISFVEVQTFSLLSKLQASDTMIDRFALSVYVSTFIACNNVVGFNDSFLQTTLLW